MSVLEIELKGVTICVDDIQVTGYDCDAYVEDCVAWFKDPEVDIEEENLLITICEIVTDQYPDIVAEISAENAMCAAEAAYDSMMDR